MVRGVTEITLEPGEYEFLARSRGIARLFIDGEEILTIPKAKRGGGAHNPVQPVPAVPRPGMRPHAMDDVEKITTFTSPGGTHVAVFDVMLGGPRLRLEFGEAAVAFAKKGEMFRLVGPTPGPELTDAGWKSFAAKTSAELDSLDRRTRRAADRQSDYWEKRHQLAMQHLLSDSKPGTSIDGLVAARIERVAKQAGRADSFFNREVRPIFSEHCYRCHGEKGKRRTQSTGPGEHSQGRRLGTAHRGSREIPTRSFLLEVVWLPMPGDDKMPPKGDGLNESEIADPHKVDFSRAGNWMRRAAEIESPFPRSSMTSPSCAVSGSTPWGWLPRSRWSAAFQDNPDPNKRSAMIKRLLGDDRWADNWVGYWQDVLAENP